MRPDARISHGLHLQERPPMTMPPLSAIRCFEAAARHQSFTRAAGELGITQAAMSYQIKLLEERLGPLPDGGWRRR
jgi:hypothetical protein